MVVAGLQELVARASIFLPPYDQRLSSDLVVSLHETISNTRRRVCPQPAFSFKTRKSPPASLSALIAQVRVRWIRMLASPHAIFCIDFDAHPVGTA